jgi:AraC family transcriptional regulator, regulatory protein of adaptative response / methylated-DNA-[protein]-cysteine methyltransferase
MNASPKLVGNHAELSPSRWNAVQQRASSVADFVYAVRSTKIYCRPSCPSRRPKPQHVLFFDSSAEAERAGFRACRRCRPEIAAPDAGASALVRKVCEKIESTLAAEPDAPLTLAELARSFGLSSHQLNRAFRKVLRVSPRQFADARRMSQLKSRLRNGEKLTSAMYDAGFGSSSRLYERAPSQMGMTPGAYRHGGAGMQIHYTIVPCPLGNVLVAGTARGISAVYLGDSKPQLQAALAREYPRAEILDDAAGLGPWVREVLRHLRGEEPHRDLPLDVQATAFQRRVWEELRRIPWGSTRTYSQIARSIGREKAVRAVARACATNPVSIVVPCHRVIGKNGSLSGYRWGLSRKQALLATETRKNT